MKKITFTLMFFLLLSFTSFGQDNAEYRTTLKAMFEASGAEGSYKAVIKQSFVMFKQQYPDITSELWEELESDFLKTSLDDLTEMLVPVYSKYMTKEDLEEIIKFYKTPAGQNFAKNTPMIMQESMQVGQEWGMKIGQKFTEKMKEKGY